KALENSKVSFSTPNGGIYGEVGVNTFRNAIDAHYLPHSSEYVAPLSIDIVRPWFETIGYGEAVPAKWTLKKSLLPPSGMSAFNLNKPIYSASFIVHSESALGNDDLAVSIAKVDPGKSALSTDLYVLADQTKFVSEGLETVLTQPITGKGASSIARQVKKEETSSPIKLEDLVKLVLNMQPNFKDLDSPEDDPFIVVDDSDEDKEDEVHTTTKDTSVLKFSSPRSS
ncbi:hypothetical protein Tco_0154724, partial [Tanacetum coccineum]